MRIESIRTVEILEYEKELQQMGIATEIVVSERSKDTIEWGKRTWGKMERFHATFEDSGVKEGNFLAGTYGNGETPDEAIAAYAKQISGKQLTFVTHTKDRRDIYVPNLIHTTVTEA